MFSRICYGLAAVIVVVAVVPPLRRVVKPAADKAVIKVAGCIAAIASPAR